jgi:hypothetical protein
VDPHAWRPRLAGVNEDGSPGYHDLHITAAEIPRTSIFSLAYGLEVTCTRVAGWQLWRHRRARVLNDAALLAGEYDGPGKWLVLDVGGHVIVDSRQRAAPR